MSKKHAILLVGHGSRDPEGNQELLVFAERVQEQLAQEFPIVETCFLEFAAPSIPKGIDTCVARGAEAVTLVPVILFGAGHSKLHIPHEIDEARERHPHVAFSYGKPIGVHTKALDILSSRLAEAGFSPSGTERTDDAVLIVGRGSSDPDANSDLCKISRLLFEQVPVGFVETCYIGVTEPDFAGGVERCVKLGAKRIFILPYFLFTGVLIKRMESMTEAFQQTYPDVQMVMADYFGFHDNLVNIIHERAVEAAQGETKMNCDLCKYRLAAMEDHHHHHHHDHDHDHDHHHDHDHDHDHDHNHDHDHHHEHDHAEVRK
ncbi:sirohydrochlorin chelatase [Tumebacillus algifaecis]|uniref:Sirohydrochlorin chelatase n=1 Tax=Tumebacillus algifaecis TaxID=1214604 RepID=A0A223D4C8_9BACL|nr:sirohydrochlorin chelatase [Tumebacillus algifaecis]ASS76479.1 sirohydrochlorin chelatase [Tumebacillus algifaecis]